MRNPYDWIKFHGREGVMRFVRHPYYWLKHYPERRRFLRSHAKEIAENRAFDLRYGVDTAVSLDLVNFNIPYDSWRHGAKYGCSNETEFAEVMRALDINCEDFTFIDLGAGRGKVLLLASEFPFRKIVGVEFSPDLVRSAESNVERFVDATGRRDRDISCLCGDAMQFEFPATPLLVYLMNPFDDVILRPTIANLVASLEAAPREIRIVYVNPRFQALFDEAPLFERGVTTDRYSTWRSRPEHSRPK